MGADANSLSLRGKAMATIKLHEVVKTEYEFVAKHGLKLIFEKEGEVWNGLICLALASNPKLKMIVSADNLSNGKPFDFSLWGLFGDVGPSQCAIIKISPDLIEMLGLEL